MHSTEPGSPAPPPVAVLGAGAWGSALALFLAARPRAVRLWGHDAGHVAALQRERENRRALPGFVLPPNVAVTASLETAIEGVRDVVLAVPSHAMGEVFGRLAPRAAGLRLVNASKGFAPDRDELLDGLAARVCGAEVPYAVVSGPTFAAEVAAGYPAALSIASRHRELLRDATALFHARALRVYATDDVTGVQVAGAVKNVLALAAGIADGLGFGANTRAALVTRGLAELMRLGEAMGGRRETFMGLAGLGDLVLTCTDDKSRNRRCGLALGRGAAVREAEREVGQTVEGVRAARICTRVAGRFGVEMPIAEQVCAVLDGGQTPRGAVAALLARAPTRE